MTLQIDPALVGRRRSFRAAGLFAIGTLGQTRRRGAVKSAIDRLGAIVGLVTLAPVLLIVSLAIFSRRDGPVFYGHMRVGKDGRLFRCWKFRTMVPDGGRRFDAMLAIDPIARDDWETRRKIYRDPRVSRLGAVLRATSLDELPQFWNVLRGDMSLVGPRPVTAEELPHYGDHLSTYLAVRPGMTGAWQVSGRSEATFAERVALDVAYVRSQSLRQDLSIMLKTLRVVLGRQGAM